MTNQKPLDLDWLAIRFVLDELETKELEECERLLGADQPFREAVARAVELLDATRRAAVAPTTLVAPSRGWASLIAGVSLGVAASFLIAAAMSLSGWIQLGPRLENQLSEVSPEGIEDASIVALWSERVRMEDANGPSDDVLADVTDEESNALELADSPSPWLVEIAKLPDEADEPTPQEDSDG